jgi:cytochrome b6-f complex iron-sulfur subunit
MSKISRRDFLKMSTHGLLGISGLLALDGLIRFLGYKPDPPPPKIFDVGSKANYPLNTRTVLPNIPAILIHTADGFSALSMVCTHLGCTVDASPNGFVCPCHGSRYDLAGGLLAGPAGRPLKPLRVETTAGDKLVIYKS